MVKNVKPVSLAILFLIGILTLTVSGFSKSKDSKISINYPKATKISCFKIHENEITGYNSANTNTNTYGPFGIECPVDIVIPLGKTIADFAFLGLADRVSSVTIHGNIKRLKAYTFADSNLEFVTFHEGLEIIDTGSFSSNRLTSINFPKSLRIIGGFAFEDNTFRYLDIPDNVIYIGPRAFRDNKRLTTVIIGYGIREIRNGAFLGTSVDKVCIRAPESNVIVASNAFPSFTTIKYDCTDEEDMFHFSKTKEEEHKEKRSEEKPLNFICKYSPLCLLFN